MAKVKSSGSDIGRVDGIDFDLGAASSALSIVDGVATLDLEAAVAAILASGPVTTTYVILTDGVTAPGTTAGQAKLYVDTSDGDLKVKFGDGFAAAVQADS